ncbi:MAG: VWA domain-containing protein [Bacillota bacterium]|nr:VWA domain-containing protein [Bacillota bacterium]
MSKGLTEVVFILDRSGSMQGLEVDTIGGFNSVLAKQKQAREEGADAVVTTVLFDGEYELLHDRFSLDSVEEISGEDYWVRGCTALLDAVGRTIKKTEAAQKNLPEGKKADKVLFVIITDGMENASQEFSYSQVKEMIKAHEEDNWEFLFLGANIDAAAEAERIGIRRSRSARYVPDGAGTAVSYESIGNAVRSAMCCECSEKFEVDEEWCGEILEDYENRG